MSKSDKKMKAAVVDSTLWSFAQTGMTAAQTVSEGARTRGGFAAFVSEMTARGANRAGPWKLPNG